jgi:hypothetical protein
VLEGDRRRSANQNEFAVQSHMIENIDEFEARLRLLNPDEVDFVHQTDELVEALDPGIRSNVYEAVFRFFEAHPDSDCGAPGTLVHHLEEFYPNYVDALVDSLHRKPSYNGVLMVNRILNSEVKGGLRTRLLKSLQKAANDANSSKQVRVMASKFHDRHA